jgi:hypothetical protein
MPRKPRIEFSTRSFVHCEPVDLRYSAYPDDLVALIVTVVAGIHSKTEAHSSEDCKDTILRSRSCESVGYKVWQESL